jgi:hypothetical protein
MHAFALADCFLVAIFPLAVCFLLTICPLLRSFKSVFFSPVAVFAFAPLKTCALASLPFAITLARFFFIT